MPHQTHMKAPQTYREAPAQATTTASAFQSRGWSEPAELQRVQPVLDPKLPRPPSTSAGFSFGQVSVFRPGSAGPDNAPSLRLSGHKIPVASRPIPKLSPNRTGLPDKLKAGVEALSGMSMDNVRVHRNSAKPAQLQALAYTQGTNIHVGPGQEQHLPHEAWHVVQQAQGRVQPTIQLKDGVSVNDDQALEREADVIGAKAAVMGHLAPPSWFSQAGGGWDQAHAQRRPMRGLHNEEPLNFLSTRYSLLDAVHNNLATGSQRLPSHKLAHTIQPMMKKKFKGTPMDLTPLKVNSWSTPLTSKPVPSIPEQIDEEMQEVPDNQFIKNLIATQGNFTVKSIGVDGDRMTEETVYYTITVAGPLQSAEFGYKNRHRDLYQLYLHYHPKPIGDAPNWLHIKRAHGGPAGNKVEKSNWLFKNHKNVLTAGREAWKAMSKEEVDSKYQL